MNFPAETQYLPDMLTWVRQRCKEAELSPDDARRTEIALEEVFINIITYAYVGKKGNLAITCRIEPHTRIEFTVQDQGLPFNPILHKPALDYDADLDEREEGGLGLFLTHEFMDDMHYERQTPFNILTLIKKLD